MFSGTRRRPAGVGYIATFCAIAATAMIAPSFVTASIYLLGGALKKVSGAAGLLAGRSLVAALARTSVVITALATAIAIMVSVGIMVGRFRETVEVWLNGQLRADIYLRAQGPATAGIYAPLSNAVPAVIRSTPGVGEVDTLHAMTFHYENQQATSGAGNMDIVACRRNIRFLNGGAGPILASLAGHDRCIVSEPFANKHRVRAGDLLRIPLGNRVAALTVAGIYYEYSSDRGFVLVDNGTLAKYLPEAPITNIAVHLKPGADAARVRRDLEARTPR